MNNCHLHSPRTDLQLITIADLEAIHKLHSCPEVDQFNTLGIPKSLEETRVIITAWIIEMQAPLLKNYTFAIRSVTDRAFIGLLGLKVGALKYNRAEVWYKIHPDHWNQGFATEVLKTVISYAFNTLKLHRIEAGCAVANLGSIRVLEKVGMTQEGRGRHVLPLVTGWSDNFEYAILESDYRLGFKM